VRMNLQEKIHELMEKRGWSMYRLANESGVSWSTIRNMFQRGTDPTVYTLEALCRGLDISMAELLLGPDYPELDDSTKELINNWNALDEHDRKLIIELTKSLNKEKDR